MIRMKERRLFTLSNIEIARSLISPFIIFHLKLLLLLNTVHQRLYIVPTLLFAAHHGGVDYLWLIEIRRLFKLGFLSGCSREEFWHRLRAYKHWGVEGSLLLEEYRCLITCIISILLVKCSKVCTASIMSIPYSEWACVSPQIFLRVFFLRK